MAVGSESRDLAPTHRSGGNLQRVLRRRARRDRRGEHVPVGLGATGVRRYVLGRSRADHDRRPAGDSRQPGAVVPRAARHPADGRQARAAGHSGSQRRRRGAGWRARRHRAVGDPGWNEDDGAARSIAADHGVSGDRDLGRQGIVDHPDICRSAARATTRRQEGREGEPQRDRRQGHHRPQRPVPARRRRAPAVSPAVVADVSVRPGGDRDRSRAIDDLGHSRIVQRVSLRAQGPLRGQRSDAAAHFRRRLAHGATVRA